jgi:hypothetical protein
VDREAGRLAEPFETKYVARLLRPADAKGRIHFAGHRLYCSLAFAGRRLALRPTNQDGLFELCYRRHLLARIDLRQDTMQPVHHVSEQVSTMSPV